MTQADISPARRERYFPIYSYTPVSILIVGLVWYRVLPLWLW
jgi:hypothetical protein